MSRKPCESTAPLEGLDAELFAPGLLHELRQPLMGAHAALTLLERSLGASLAGVEDWRLLKAQLARLTEIVSGYEDLLRPSAAPPSPFEIAPVVRRAVELLPNDVFVLNQAAWLLATAPEDDVRDEETALSYAHRAVKLTDGGDAVSLDSLAVAYAGLGLWNDARVTIRHALAVVPSGPLETQLREHQQAIEAQRPIR